MRPFFPTAVFALCLSACSGADDEGDTADFKPPTAQSRKNFEEVIGRRFNRLDHNHDSVLDVSDVPKRLARWDTDQDGKVTPGEFRAADIARFVAADADKDDVLTTLERARAKWNDVPQKSAE